MSKIFISCCHSDTHAEKLYYFIKNFDENLTIESNADFSRNTNSGDVTYKIDKCEIFICFIDNDSPNVMFELGYAFGKNKKVILIGESYLIPFDLRNNLYLKRGCSPYAVIEQIIKYSGGAFLFHEELKFSKMRADRIIEVLLEKPEIIDSIDPIQFEEIIASWFKLKGYEVIERPLGRDNGYDFSIASFKGDRALVEVKKHKINSQVSVAAIRQLLGSMAIEKRCKYGIIVSSGSFTQASRYYAKEIGLPLILWNIVDLHEMKNMHITEIESKIRTPC